MLTFCKKVLTVLVGVRETDGETFGTIWRRMMSLTALRPHERVLSFFFLQRLPLLVMAEMRSSQEAIL